MFFRGSSQPSTLFRHFFLSLALFTGLTIVGCTWLIYRVVVITYAERVRHNLYTNAKLIATQTINNIADFEQLTAEIEAVAATDANLRITIISPTGVVLADSGYPGSEGETEEESRQKVSSMENHANYSEVINVLNGKPYALRTGYSPTFQQHFYYLAVPIRKTQDGPILGICRVGYPVDVVFYAQRHLTDHIFMISTMAFLLLVLLCILLTRSISRPLQELAIASKTLSTGSLTIRLQHHGILELDHISDSFNAMSQALHEKVTAFQREHSYISMLFNSLADGLIVISHDNRIQRVNNVVREWFQILPDLAIQNQPIAAHIRQTAILNLIYRIRTTGTPQESELILPPIIPESSQRNLLIQGNLTPTSDPKAPDILLIMTDVTRLKYLETLRRDFAANVSHELRTPVTAIMGFVETLENGALDDPECAHRFLSIIHAHTLRLGNVISDILALTRIERENEAGTNRLPMVPLHALLQQAFEIWKPIAQEKKITLLLENASPDTLLPLNEGLFMQALGNLVGNAINYSPSDTSVRIYTEAASAEVTVHVTDEGPGIPKEHHARIFEQFYTVDKARSRATGGTGLGLSLVKHIMQLHAGVVCLMSEPGKGSTFSLHFPKTRQ